MRTTDVENYNKINILSKKYLNSIGIKLLKTTYNGFTYIEEFKICDSITRRNGKDDTILISTFGRLYSINDKNFLKINFGKDGYLKIWIKSDKSVKGMYYYIGKLIAAEFLCGETYSTFNSIIKYIDGTRCNVIPDNLLVINKFELNYINIIISTKKEEDLIVFIKKMREREYTDEEIKYVIHPFIYLFCSFMKKRYLKKLLKKYK